MLALASLVSRRQVSFFHFDPVNNSLFTKTQLRKNAKPNNSNEKKIQVLVVVIILFFLFVLGFVSYNPVSSFLIFFGGWVVGKEKLPIREVGLFFGELWRLGFTVEMEYVEFLLC